MQPRKEVEILKFNVQSRDTTCPDNLGFSNVLIVVTEYESAVARLFENAIKRVQVCI